jgi:protease-4
MPARQSNLLLWVVVGSAALLFFILCLLALGLTFSGDSMASFSLGGNQVALLDIEGVIFDSRQFINQLKLYGRRSGVKAVVLRLNSPGGGVAASQEIYEAVQRFRAETQKIVVVSMATVAASGGYYIACAADKIFANPGSITGSIGVIAEWYNYEELLKWAKLRSVIFKSGDLKDAGSPTRPMTDAEKAYFQDLIDTMYTQFVSAVATGRGMDEEVVRALADGRVFTGQEAQTEGLVDELGTLQDAIRAAAQMSGIEGEPSVIKPPKKAVSLLDLLMGDVEALLPVNPDRSDSHIRFQYLWR